MTELITDVIALTLKRHYRRDAIRCGCGAVFASFPLRASGADLHRQHVAEQIAVLVEAARRQVAQ